MSWLGRLFGRQDKTGPAPAGEEYKGFRIIPTPIPEGRVYRLSARIEHDVEGETKHHTLVRADTLESQGAAADAAIAKARQVIDEQGLQLFK